MAHPLLPGGNASRPAGWDTLAGFRASLGAGADDACVCATLNECRFITDHEKAFFYAFLHPAAFRLFAIATTICD